MDQWTDGMRMRMCVGRLRGSFHRMIIDTKSMFRFKHSSRGNNAASSEIGFEIVWGWLGGSGSGFSMQLPKRTDNDACEKI